MIMADKATDPSYYITRGLIKEHDRENDPEKRLITNSVLATRHKERLKYSPKPDCKTCTGDVDIGLFFDGTDNNMKRDYGEETNPHSFIKRQHTNIVRLFQAFPDENDKNPKRFTIKTSNKSYAYYVPGVGTEFKEIGDSGKGLKSTMGSAMGLGCEPRIIWGLIQVLNAMARFYGELPVIPDGEAKTIIPSLCSETRLSKKYPMLATTMLPLSSVTVGQLTDSFELSNAQATVFGVEVTYKDQFRIDTFKTWIKERIKPLIDSNRTPRLRRAIVHIFGFSRGAAEARCFHSYLAEICDEGSSMESGLKIAGVDIFVPFLGIFDTVASVGVAGLYSFSEGHMSWATKDRLRILPFVGRCMHIVAGHEVRACFPLDSVRMEKGGYPSNTTEVVYPGAHSDLGGGYALLSLGKDDTKDPEDDLQISRVCCFEMYWQALMAGVPFYSLEELKSKPLGELLVKNLLPSLETVQEMINYKNVTNISGTVEEQCNKHTGYYLGWRYSLGEGYFSEDPYELQNEKVRGIYWYIEKNVREKIKKREQRIRELMELDTKGEIEKKDLYAEFATLNDLDKEIEADLKNKGSVASLHYLLNEIIALRSIKETRPLTPDEERELGEKIKKRDDYAKTFRVNFDEHKDVAFPSAEIRNLKSDRTKSSMAQQLGARTPNPELEYLQLTQRELLQVVAGYCKQIEYRIGLFERVYGQLDRKKDSPIKTELDQSRKNSPAIYKQKLDGNSYYPELSKAEILKHLPLFNVYSPAIGITLNTISNLSEKAQSILDLAKGAVFLPQILSSRSTSGPGNIWRTVKKINNVVGKIKTTVKVISFLSDISGNASKLINERKALLFSGFMDNRNYYSLGPLYLSLWRNTLRKFGFPELRDPFGPERDPILLLEALADWQIKETNEAFYDVTRKFFAKHVHDSVAGFRGKDMPEFECNGYGIAKFRRIYLGTPRESIIAKIRNYKGDLTEVVDGSLPDADESKIQARLEALLSFIQENYKETTNRLPSAIVKNSQQ